MTGASKVEIVRGRRGPLERCGLSCAVLLSLSACAGAAAEAPASAAPAAAIAAQVAALQEKLDAREALVAQLESRISLLEAEQRQLRFAVAERDVAPLGLRETVRIGAPEGAREEREPKREARPLLRLYEDRRASQAALEPIPQVDERLPVAPLPDKLEPRERASGEPARDPYVAAIDLVRQRDFEAALRALSQFIAAHPDDPRLAKAQFWRGEVLFAQKSYGPALRAFESALSREPRGEKAPDSLLKIGLCHKRLGAPDRARDAIEQLKKQFPESHAARLAQAEEA